MYNVAFKNNSSKFLADSSRALEPVVNNEIELNIYS